MRACIRSAGKTWSQPNWKPWKSLKPEDGCYMQPTAKCKQKKKRQCVSKNQELFVTVAVLSLGKLCEDIGYSYHWTSGQRPQLIKDGRRIKCSTANCEPIVVLGLSTSSSSCTYISNIIIAASLSSCTASRINKKVRAQVALRENGETRRVNQKKNRNQNKKQDNERARRETRCVICPNG